MLLHMFEYRFVHMSAKLAEATRSPSGGGITCGFKLPGVGAERRSSERAASTLNCSAVSPASQMDSPTWHIYKFL